MAWAEVSVDQATFSVTAEAIPGGVVLRFDVPEELKRRIDYFLLAKSSQPLMLTDIPASTFSKFAYYHDWHKDYFSKDDVGQTIYYHVEAFGNSGIAAYSWPLWTAWKVKNFPLTGVMLTPSAYRRIPLYESQVSQTRDLLPINWDWVMSYYIGRLYGYNQLEELASSRKNLFSRVGVSFLQTDLKFILERERKYFPQLAFGLEATQMIRDTSPPDVSNPSAEFLVKKGNQRSFGGLFLAASKEIGWFRSTIGWMQGTSPSKVIYLTELLPKASESDSGVFFNVSAAANKRFGIQWELLKPLRAKNSPWLINAQLGRLLHANFDVAYLHYEKGYEILAHLNFRLTVYPGGKK